MMDKINGKLRPAGRKIYMYSAHDNNVINILAALDLYQPPHFPNYSSATIIELHLMDNNQYAIKVRSFTSISSCSIFSKDSKLVK